MITKAAFWHKIHDLPLACQTEETIMSITWQVGSVVAYDKPTTLSLAEFLRVKIEIDVTKPLRRGIQIHFTGDLLWIPITYESLPTYYFCCGVIGHFFRSCKFFDRDEDLKPEEMKYGPMLKASMGRRNKGLKVETIFINDGGSVESCNVPNSFLPETRAHTSQVGIINTISPSYTDPALISNPTQTRAQTQPHTITTLRHIIPESTIPTERIFNTLATHLTDINHLTEALTESFTITPILRTSSPSLSRLLISAQSHSFSKNVPVTFPILFQPTNISIHSATHIGGSSTLSHSDDNTQLIHNATTGVSSSGGLGGLEDFHGREQRVKKQLVIWINKLA
ncbi:hypothetical protein ACS0TY_024197 [Phlomoides rotata]